MASKAASQARPFSVDLDASVVADFKRRLREARWPGTPVNAEDWAYGMSLPYLRSLVEYATSDAFDWKRVQDRLNSVPQFTASVPNRRSKIHKNRLLCL